MIDDDDDSSGNIFNYAYGEYMNILSSTKLLTGYIISTIKYLPHQNCFQDNQDIYHTYLHIARELESYVH